MFVYKANRIGDLTYMEITEKKLSPLDTNLLKTNSKLRYEAPTFSTILTILITQGHGNFGTDNYGTGS